jgi:hypothetical protein
MVPQLLRGKIGQSRKRWEIKTANQVRLLGSGGKNGRDQKNLCISLIYDNPSEA